MPVSSRRAGHRTAAGGLPLAAGRTGRVPAPPAPHRRRTPGLHRSADARHQPGWESLLTELHADSW